MSWWEGPLCCSWEGHTPDLGQSAQPGFEGAHMKDSVGTVALKLSQAGTGAWVVGCSWLLARTGVQGWCRWDPAGT